VLRLTEIALLVLPLLAFVTWRLLGGGRELPAGTVAAMGFALAVFADAGRLWAGDAPFGTTTPMRYSAGFSLLTAFPARSAQMWRLDVAFPNVPGRGVRLALRLTHTDATSVFWREPADVAVARERSVPASLFNWP